MKSRSEEREAPSRECSVMTPERLGQVGSARQSRPGLGEMTNEEVGGSIRYGVGVDAEERVIGSFDPLHLAGSTDCLQRLMHQCALFRR